jgi:hypothetical protein
LLTSSAIASDCPISDSQKSTLINGSPYFVDDVFCRGQTLQWDISNRRVMANGEVLPVILPKIRPIAKTKQNEIVSPVKKVTQAPLEKVLSQPPIPFKEIEEKIIVKIDEVDRPKPPMIKKAITEAKPKEIIQKAPSRAISFIPGLNAWNTSVTYGPKYLSMKQNGSLIDGADVSVTLFNNMKVKSEFIFDNWASWFRFETYRFKYASLTKEDSKPMNALEFGVSYKGLIATLGSDENPLFRDNGGEVELASMNILYLGVGYKKDFEIPSMSETFLRIKGIVRYPISTGTGDTNVKTSGVSGYSAIARAELSRQIFSRVNYSVDLTFMGGVDYQTLAQNVKWGTQDAYTDSSIFSASAGLGLLFSLK